MKLTTPLTALFILYIEASFAVDVRPSQSLNVEPEVHSEHLRSGELASTKLSIAASGEGCGVNSHVTRYSTRGKTCPEECPLYVHDQLDSKHCSFQCVPNTVQDCLSRNNHTTVPDLKLGACRACRVAGCKVCREDGTDTCSVCKEGFELSKGECHSTSFWIWYVVFAVLGTLILFIVVWLACLAYTDAYYPAKNKEGLRRGLSTRSACKLHQPLRSHHHRRKLYPANTSLLTEPIAGVGVMHLFNFECALIVWGIGVFLGWLALGLFVDYDYFRVGIQPPGETERDNCIVVAWGFATQTRLLSGKVAFIGVVYVVSFVSAILYSIYRHRTHQRCNAHPRNGLRHKQYCAQCFGLAPVAGKERLEERLKEFVEGRMGKSIVGVSVIWDFYGQEDVFMKILQKDMDIRLHEVEGTPPPIPGISPRTDFSPRTPGTSPRTMPPDQEGFFGFFRKWEAFLLSPSVQRIVKKQHGSTMMAQSCIRRLDDAQENDEDEIYNSARPNIEISDDCPRWAVRWADLAVARSLFEQKLLMKTLKKKQELDKLKCTSCAFIVFHSQSDRDAAINNFSEKDGVDFSFKLEYAKKNEKTYSSKIRLSAAECDPQGVQWNRVTERSLMSWVARLSAGVGCIFLALLFWLCIYYPYASSVLSSDYANGTSPSEFNHMMFGFIVIGGNALMYVVCSEVADRIGFKYQSQREMCYMVSYFFACVTNVILDLAMVYAIAYKEQVGKGMTTYDGKRLGEVTSFNAILETYAMQKSLGQMLLDYSFPATFLIPFLAEPFVVIIAPYVIMSLIVKRHEFIRGFTADAYLAATPMDLSRYADVLLNVMLAVAMFFFPGGYMLYTFGGLIISHIIIFNYDRYRVLRSIPACNFSKQDVDKCAQWLLSIPCGLLLSCFMFKANCEDLTHLELCYADHHIHLKCGVLLCAHVALHSFLLFCVVPKFGLDAKKLYNDAPYKKCAEAHASSWFSANPIHCLRSRYFYGNEPRKGKIPCYYLLDGFPHLLQKDKSQCLYHKAKKFDGSHEEEYGVRNQAYGIAETLPRTLTGVTMFSNFSSQDSLSPPSSSSGSSEDEIDESKIANKV